jgi:biopolymer transport protein ExbD
MAKREIPEINAGSMADIAFLLLIFFLVTTTMDKDQAYKRSIPKKVVVPPTDLPEVEEKNILAIKSNSQNQILIRDEIVQMDNISDWVLKFYRANEKKIVDMDFPFYSRTSMTEMDEAIKRIDKQIDDLEKQENTDDFIMVKMQEREAWMKKKRALTLYRGPVLPEISSQANIRIEVAIATQYEIFAKIHSEIEEAITELKDGESRRIFGTPYEVLKRKNEQDAAGLAEKDKLELLDLLYPAKIIEVTPKK